MSIPSRQKKTHWLHDILLRQSAFQCSLPARCSISMSYVDMTSSYRTICPSGSLNPSSHLEELWSVLTKNLWPHKKDLKCFMKVTTTRVSFLVTQYFFLDLVSILLAYATTFSCPSWICDSVAPITYWLASVSNINGFEKSECVRIGALASLS